jgi:integrase
MTLGLRPGELTGLLWSDLDLGANPPTLTISGSMKRSPDGTATRGEVKRSRAGQRTIALPPLAVENTWLRSCSRRGATGRPVTSAGSRLSGSGCASRATASGNALNGRDGEVEEMGRDRSIAGAENGSGMVDALLDEVGVPDGVLTDRPIDDLSLGSVDERC